MRGKMLWFNAEKGFGFIQTEDEERLYVGRSGFLPGQVPVGRCKGQEVIFERVVAEGDPYAENVAFPALAEPRRARLRQQRGGRSL